MNWLRKEFKGLTPNWTIIGLWVITFAVFTSGIIQLLRPIADYQIGI